jgi:hypothetical protein
MLGFTAFPERNAAWCAERPIFIQADARLNMKVKKLIKLLKMCEPDADVTINHPYDINDLTEDIYVRQWRERGDPMVSVHIGAREESETYPEIAAFPDFSEEWLPTFVREQKHDRSR